MTKENKEIIEKVARLALIYCHRRDYNSFVRLDEAIEVLENRQVFGQMDFTADRRRRTAKAGRK